MTDHCCVSHVLEIWMTMVAFISWQLTKTLDTVRSHSYWWGCQVRSNLVFFLSSVSKMYSFFINRVMHSLRTFIFCRMILRTWLLCFSLSHHVMKCILSIYSSANILKQRGQCDSFNLCYIKNHMKPKIYYFNGSYIFLLSTKANQVLKKTQTNRCSVVLAIQTSLVCLFTVQALVLKQVKFVGFVQREEYLKRGWVLI